MHMFIQITYAKLNMKLYSLLQSDTTAKNLKQNDKPRACITLYILHSLSHASINSVHKSNYFDKLIYRKVPKVFQFLSQNMLITTV